MWLFHTFTTKSFSYAKLFSSPGSVQPCDLSHSAPLTHQISRHVWGFVSLFPPLFFSVWCCLQMQLHSTCVSLFFPHRKLRKLASPELCVWTCENTLVHWKIAKIEPQDGFMFKNGEWFGLFLLFNVKLRNQKMVDISSDEPLCTSFFLNTSLLLCHCSRARVFREFPFSHECHNTGSLKD